ncbi:putative serine protease family S10 [Phytophthora cinnamomi]|uniref:putative serine protease family S10 n=1 Tax=Phytophthora cinnamomi TaxID=4785 RepID=UPI00355AC04F|nr:putative serine protease family S10 [Phytophthora cinnamomi]
MRRTSELTPLVAEGARAPRLSGPARFVRRSATRSSLLVTAGVALLLTLAFVVHQDATLSSVKNLKGVANNYERPQDFFCGITNHETGYIKLPNKKDDHYFYWFVESRSSPQKDPLVLWLTGGPGCSSMMALLAENGPCHVQPDLSTRTNPHSWNGQANVIWLDQPTGVGYSYGPKVDYDSGELNVAENIYWFLQEFLKKHPDLADRELFVTGESYGGHYVPATASHIMKANMLRHSGSETFHINLAGIAVGNGLTDPAVQYQHSVDMAFNSYNVSLLDEQGIDDMRKAQPVCHELILRCEKERSTCFDAMEFCFGALEGPYLQSGRNPYDIREPCAEVDVMKCFDFDHIDEYLNLPAVLAELGVDVHKSKPWRECDATVGAGFVFDEMVSSANDVKLLLDSGITLFICRCIIHRTSRNTGASMLMTPTPIVSHRDYCCLEVKDNIVDSFGNEMYIRILNSIEINECPSLENSHGLVRAKILAGYMYCTDRAEPNVVRVHHVARFDPGGYFPSQWAFKTAESQLVNCIVQIRHFTTSKYPRATAVSIA